MMDSNGILPPPPIFKPTIIQMKGSSSSYSSNSSNSNILTTLSNQDQNLESPRLELSPTKGTPQLSSNDLGLPPSTASKKRRRSSQIVDQEELAKKRKELKAAHSVIEKKRRIKMNREFEALKYLVPACRSSIIQSLLQPPSASSSPSIQPLNYNGNSRSGSISLESSLENLSQMHKLTILQSTVEYISYLHHIIQLQDTHLLKYEPNYNLSNDLKFTEFELNLDEYRDIDKSYDFNSLFKELVNNGGKPIKFDSINKELKRSVSNGSPEIATADSVPSTQLPSPLVTPNIDVNIASLNRFKLNSNSSSTTTNTFTTAAATASSNNSRPGATTEFQLPLPMISSSNKATRTVPVSPLMTSIQQSQQTNYQESVPKDLRDSNSGRTSTQSPREDTERTDELSRVLLSIKDDKGKKNSISNLLN